MNDLILKGDNTKSGHQSSVNGILDKDGMRRMG